MARTTTTLFLLALSPALSCSADKDGSTTTDGTTPSDVCGDGVATGDEACDAAAESADCNADCTVALCGDGTLNASAGEACDDVGESADCNADCTPAVCGDGIVNAAAGEVCEPSTGEPWDRCSVCIVYGAGLDGTFGTKWTPLSTHKNWDDVAGLQSFHYSGEPALYDFTTNHRYDIAKDEWTELATEPPFGTGTYWPNGAVDSAYIWVPRGQQMHRFELASETWSTVKGKKLPDGDDQEGAAIFDGSGQIWYHGPDDLVRYDPSTGAFEQYSYAKVAKNFDVYETRLAYDPVSETIALTGYENDRFLLFDIATETFSEGAPSPDGAVHDNTCQDRAGGVYAGNEDYSRMYRYDIANDDWTVLPDLPVPHDNNSSCVVSQDGYLYFGTSEKKADFFRLPLGVAGG